MKFSQAVLHLAKRNPTFRRMLASEIQAEKNWVQKAIKRPGRLHKHFGIPEDEDIPVSKIKSEIKKLEGKETRTKEETSLLRALNMALTLKKMHG